MCRKLKQGPGNGMRSSFIAWFEEDARIDSCAGWVNRRAVFVVRKSA